MGIGYFLSERGRGVSGISADQDLPLEKMPTVWRFMSLLGPGILSDYESDFLGCRIERLFFFVWRIVISREYKMLGKRLDNWYSEDLGAKPESHRPLEQRRSIYPALLRGEEAAFAAELNPIQRVWYRYCLITLPLASDYLDAMRYRYRFFGMGDEVWIGSEQKGRGNVPD